MRHYHRLAEDDRVKRRTIADAVEVLGTIPDFTKTSQSKICVHPLPLPSGDLVGLVDVAFDGPLPEVVCLVSLPTSGRFCAIRRGAARREFFDIFRLDGATFDGTATVTLADGTSLRAVEVIPAHLPLEPTELDWRIVHLLIAMQRAEKLCYRHWRSAAPPAIRRMVPKQLVFVKFQALRKLKPPPLAEIAKYIANHDWTLRRLSQQKIADALRNFGIRLPASRPRAKARRSSAAI